MFPVALNVFTLSAKNNCTQYTRSSVGVIVGQFVFSLFYFHICCGNQIRDKNLFWPNSAKQRDSQLVEVCVAACLISDGCQGSRSHTGVEFWVSHSPECLH